MRKPILSLLILSIVLCAAIAEATVRNSGVKIRLLESPRPVRPGEPFAGTFEIEATPDLSVEAVRVGGAKWLDFTADSPRSKWSGTSETQTVAFRGTPDALSDLVTVTVETDQGVWENTLDLSAWSADVRQRSAGTIQRDPATIGIIHPYKQGDPPRGWRHGQAPAPLFTPPSDLEPEGDPLDMTVSGPDKARTIRVVGNFSYRRDDGTWIPPKDLSVRVYDQDSTWDDLLASSYLDEFGNYDLSFSWDPCTFCDQRPDIYVEFETDHYYLQVQEAGILEEDYSWATSVHNDFEGDYIDYGYQGPDRHAPALHIWNTVVQTVDWLMDERGVPNLRSFDVQWPASGDNASYQPWWEEMHISTAKQWSAATITHELGHHFHHNYTDLQSADYCNGICDDPECTHCWWCEENSHDAWKEGFANWMGDVVVRNVVMAPGGVMALYESDYDIDSLHTCDGTNYGDAYITEGFVGALLHDIDDPFTDEHGVFGGRDRLGTTATSGIDEILAIVTHDYHFDDTYTSPRTVTHFLNEYRSRHQDKLWELWDTARNCGYEMDALAPFAPTGLISTTHTVGVPNPNAYITTQWQPAVDDMSGIDGYAVAVYANAPGTPTPNMDTDELYPTFTAGPLAPGTYYVSVSSIDRAGKISDTYASAGPYTVREADPQDLTWHERPGWVYPLVPRDDAGATESFAEVSSTLTGNLSATYLNQAVRNIGEMATTAATITYSVLLDGTHRHTATTGRLDAGQEIALLNQGPRNFSGGRHTLEMQIDVAGVEPELDEMNNAWGQQFIWTPLVLSTPGISLRDINQTWSEGGWESIPPSDPMYYNCDGLRFTSSDRWRAVGAMPVQRELDFDVRLHDPFTGPQLGFDSYVTRSNRPAGRFDAVIVNANTLGIQDWDVGVLNRSPLERSQYDVNYVHSSFFIMGAVDTIPLVQDEMLILREIYVSAASIASGPITLTLESLQGANDLVLNWLEPDFTAGSLLDEAGTMLVGPRQTGILHVTATTAGYHCVAVYRDQYQGTDPASFRLEIKRQPPNLVPYTPPLGWALPLVPRPAGDAGWVSVALPDTLPGNQFGTYLNVAVRNEMAAMQGEGSESRMEIDGSELLTLFVPDLGAGAFSSDLNQGPYYVRGGRHTLTVQHDYSGMVEEFVETDNVYGKQWIWSPLLKVPGELSNRMMPTPRMAGWSALTDSIIHYNCDGFRLLASEPGTVGWTGFAVLPGDTSDVDIRLHEPSTGATDGFGAYLADSNWGPGQTDMLVVNNSLRPGEDFDIGVVAMDGGQNYQAEAVASTSLGTDPYGEHGPFVILALHIMNLHEMEIGPYQTSFLLHSLRPGVPLGMALFSSDMSLAGRGDAVVAFYESESGDDLLLTFNIPVGGNTCLAVFRKDGAALQGDVDYVLEIFSGTMTDIPDNDVVHRAGISRVAPNPFNPQTTIEFNLLEQGRVDLRIYDLLGRQVRSLLSGDLEGGAHTRVWAGRDDHGQLVAGGTYLVQLKAGDVADIRKIVLVK
jgi:hypothetical protein